MWIGKAGQKNRVLRSPILVDKVMAYCYNMLVISGKDIMGALEKLSIKLIIVAGLASYAAMFASWNATQTLVFVVRG